MTRPWAVGLTAWLLSSGVVNAQLAPSPSPPSALWLSGTVLAPTGRWAILSRDGQQVSLEEGDQIGPWSVIRIGAGSVAVVGPDGEHSLTLGDVKALPSLSLVRERPFWSNPCGRSHLRDAAGRSVLPYPDPCIAALTLTTGDLQRSPAPGPP